MALFGAALGLLLPPLLALAWPGQGSAPRPPKPLLPIQPESADPLPFKGAAGCSFGGKFYALEDTWHPDLGEPFGVMHCVVCSCEPQRNRRGKTTGKVSCKNIKHDCPTLPCSDAILLPGRCCKTCPKATPSIPEKRPEPLFDNFEYFQAKEDDLHRNYNDRAYLSSEDLVRDDNRIDFVALLTSGSETWMPMSSAVAKARFTLVRAHLLFSINYERNVQCYPDIRGPHPPWHGRHCYAHPERHREQPGFCPCHQRTSEVSRKKISLAPFEDANPSPRQGPEGGAGQCHLAAIQSVLCGGDTLTPTQTGAVGSAKLMLHENGTLEYQVQVAGTRSEVIGVTLETKPRRRNKRNILYDMTHSYKDGMASGSWGQVNGRDAHMLLQNELFLNVGTKDFEEGELRGQINSLLYSGLQARYEELPVPLAGQFVSPPVRTGSAGHAWVSLDDHCHLHYEIIVAGLGKADDGTVSAHLHGFAELGELQENSLREHKRLLRGFYGTEAQGVVKDLDEELLLHLAQGTAFLQISTKANPQGEIRGKVHIPNHCEAGGIRLAPEDPEDELPGDPNSKDPEELKKDPNTCFFEGQHRPHGSRWAPDYDKKCSICSCQKRTVICDPVLCPPLNCSQLVHLRDRCCPVCEEKKETLEGQRAERARDSSGGCYFDGDKTWRGAGTYWHPVVPPFGLIKCAICTCKGATGEVHCEKVQCPHLTCNNPIRASPSDCCKQCPASEKSPSTLSDMMQSDGPRACKFGRQWYMHNESWHPTVPPFGEMKCITCWCLSGETHCQRQECSPASCSRGEKTEDSCCSKCQAPDEVQEMPQEEAKDSWGH
ncbi:chordin isoform X2 [Rhineura floridana]|uniref:chordin isoform X2 n=1 Tax=Rhineura floridana TaxID=261503 RepID=UPI002AC852C7|nr:chordin isoform X2 [Rhineura floridana]